MTRVHYFPIERYQERYTELLWEWTARAIAKRHVIVAAYGDNDLRRVGNGGSVVDGVDRVRYSCQQVSSFLKALESGKVQSGDVLWFDDMFTPGIEGIFYALHLNKIDCRIVTRCWAQTPDQYDFTFKMRHWMRHYEAMICNNVSRVWVACEELRQLCLVAGWPEDVVRVSGLPFDADSVRHMAQVKGRTVPVDHGVIYTSRWDTEKNPGLFLDLAERVARRAGSPIICTGHHQLTGTDDAAIARAYELEAKGVVRIHSNMKREDYFSLLAACKVQVNTARQDWVSFTMLEAMALGVASVVPAFRGFLECTHLDQRYLPNDIDSLEDTVEIALQGRIQHKQARFLDQHNRTLAKQVDEL